VHSGIQTASECERLGFRSITPACTRGYQWTCASQDGVTDGLADGEGRLCNRRVPHKLHALPEPLEPHLHNTIQKAALPALVVGRWSGAQATAAMLLINDDDDDDDDDLLGSETLVAAGALGRLG
jgi:hypothetical protein